MSTRLITIGVICLVISNSSLSVGATGRAPGEIDKHIIDQRHQLRQALNQWDLEALVAARAGFERLLDRGGRDWLIRYYIALADYRIAVYHMQAKELEKMDPYLEEAEQQLEESIEEEPNFGESVAMLAAILGLKITRKPISGIWIGPKIGAGLTASHNEYYEGYRTGSPAGCHDRYVDCGCRADRGSQDTAGSHVHDNRQRFDRGPGIFLLHSPCLLQPLVATEVRPAVMCGRFPGVGLGQDAEGARRLASM